MVPTAGQLVTFGALRMRILWPPAPAGDPLDADADPNHRAVVALVSVGKFDLMLPADAESGVTARLDLGDVEAMKVAHHGSADEGLPAELARLTPEIAVIEVGARNSYGHPAPSALAALRAVPDVARTDRDGTVRLHVNEGRMRLDRSRGSGERR